MKEIDKKILEVENECYLINKGVRSCALLSVSGFYQNEEDIIVKLEDLILNHNLQSFVYKQKFNDCNLEVYSFWIYKYHHQLALIKYISKLKERDFLSDWIIGKLLGYSDESMESFLTMKLIDNLDLLRESDFKELKDFS